MSDRVIRETGLAGRVRRHRRWPPRRRWWRRSNRPDCRARGIARRDVTDIAALQAAIRDAAEAVGDFHVLINNVANDDRHNFMDVTPEYYDARIAVNQRPAFFAIQAVVPGMKKMGGGSIINFGSQFLRRQGPQLAGVHHGQVLGDRPHARPRGANSANIASAST